MVDGQQLRHSPPTQHVLQCFSFERIELLSYTKMVNGMLKAANFEDIRNLHIACSRKRNCVKPPKNNRNWGWNVHYKCIGKCFCLHFSF